MKFVCLFLLVASFRLHANVSEQEKKLLDYVEKNIDVSHKLLKKIVEINSGTLNVEGVRKVGGVLAKEFEKIDMQTQWVEMPKSMNRAGHLFAKVKNKTAGGLLLVGHIDTVFEKESEFQKFEKKDNYFYGPGVNDMKGGVVVILMSLKALHSIGVLKDFPITVALIGDEENPGKPIEKARHDLIKAAQDAEYALGFEYGVKNLNYATVARRGYSTWQLQIKAKRGHSSRIYSTEFGDGANNILASFLSEAKELAKKIKGTTFNPALVGGGSDLEVDKLNEKISVASKTNIIASEAYAKGDIRTLTNDDYELLKKQLSNMMDELLRSDMGSLEFFPGAPPMAQKKGNHYLLEKLSGVSVDLGYGAVKALDPELRGAADTCYVADHVKGVIDGIGLLGDGAHSYEERVDIEAFEKVLKRTAIFLYRLLNQK